MVQARQAHPSWLQRLPLKSRWVGFHISVGREGGGGGGGGGSGGGGG